MSRRDVGDGRVGRGVGGCCRLSMRATNRPAVIPFVTNN